MDDFRRIQDEDVSAGCFEIDNIAYMEGSDNPTVEPPALSYHIVSPILYISTKGAFSGPDVCSR